MFQWLIPMSLAISVISQTIKNPESVQKYKLILTALRDALNIALQE